MASVPREPDTEETKLLAGLVVDGAYFRKQLRENKYELEKVLNRIDQEIKPWKIARRHWFDDYLLDEMRETLRNANEYHFALHEYAPKAVKCRQCGHENKMQGGADIGIATEMMWIADYEQFGAVVLLSGDRDFVEMLKLLHENFWIHIFLVGFANTQSQQLFQYAQRGKVISIGAKDESLRLSNKDTRTEGAYIQSMADKTSMTYCEHNHYTSRTSSLERVEQGERLRRGSKDGSHRHHYKASDVHTHMAHLKRSVQQTATNPPQHKRLHHQGQGARQSGMIPITSMENLAHTSTRLLVLVGGKSGPQCNETKDEYRKNVPTLVDEQLLHKLFQPLERLGHGTLVQQIRGALPLEKLLKLATSLIKKPEWAADPLHFLSLFGSQFTVNDNGAAPVQQAAPETQFNTTSTTTTTSTIASAMHSANLHSGIQPKATADTYRGPGATSQPHHILQGQAPTTFANDNLTATPLFGSISMHGLILGGDSNEENNNSETPTTGPPSLQRWGDPNPPKDQKEQSPISFKTPSRPPPDPPSASSQQQRRQQPEGHHHPQSSPINTLSNGNNTTQPQGTTPQMPWGTSSSSLPHQQRNAAASQPPATAGTVATPTSFSFRTYDESLSRRREDWNTPHSSTTTTPTTTTNTTTTPSSNVSQQQQQQRPTEDKEPMRLYRTPKSTPPDPPPQASNWAATAQQHATTTEHLKQTVLNTGLKKMEGIRILTRNSQQHNGNKKCSTTPAGPMDPAALPPGAWGTPSSVKPGTPPTGLTEEPDDESGFEDSSWTKYFSAGK